PRKSRHLHGYLLEDSSLLFLETPPNNPYLSLLCETTGSGLHESNEGQH
ncbi:DNA-binding domain-containing protein, partial [Hydrogenophaga intermedia]